MKSLTQLITNVYNSNTNKGKNPAFFTNTGLGAATSVVMPTYAGWKVGETISRIPFPLFPFNVPFNAGKYILSAGAAYLTYEHLNEVVLTGAVLGACSQPAINAAKRASLSIGSAVVSGYRKLKRNPIF